jgi:hypothetical protein
VGRGPDPVVDDRAGWLRPAYDESQGDLVDWLEAGGVQLLLGRPEPAIAHHFDAIATLAQRAGRDDLATMASAQAKTLLA